MTKNYKNTFTLFTSISFFTLLLLLGGNKGFSQETIHGKIISEIDNYEEILIVNSTRNTFTNIDTEGEFEIIAFLNDTIKVNSNSYKPASFVITTKHFEKSIQISLKDNIEDLKEIIVDSNIINDEELAEINLQLQNQIKNDIKNNPYEYTKPNSGGNLFGLIALAIDLFGKKTPETEVTPEVYINHQDLVTCFKKDNHFLTEELKIPKDQVSYFFLFVEDQKISATLLSEPNRFFFLEEITQLSIKFLQKTTN